MIKKLVFLLIIFISSIKGFSQDDPCTAIAIPLSPIGSCTYTIGDNTGATDSDLTNPNIDAPTGCEPVSANYNGADVWFSTVVGPTGNIQIDVTHIGTSNFNDGVAALYTGSCGGTLSIVECDDDSGSGSLEANFSALGLTPGTTVYIRVWDWGGNNEGTFNICASEVEDPCNSITNITDCGTTPINITIAAGFGAINDSSCEDVPGDEAVFSFTPTVTGNYTITQISTFDHINYLYQTSCAATGWTCIDDLFGNNETSGSFTMTAGTTYYIMLDSENSSGGNVSFTLNCPIPSPECGDPFYDSGGPSGDYSTNEFETTLITPTIVGDAVTVTFSAFVTENGLDYLTVYNGPDNSFPILGVFSGTTIPGPVTSSDPSGALFFEFVSDGSIQYSGWEAIVSCAPYVPPVVCGSTIYDSGGSTGDYGNNQLITTSLTPDVANTAIVATFTAFSLENNYDYLEIFDGPNNTFPSLGNFTGNTLPGTFTSSHPSGALTFVFDSDGSITNIGYAIDITCINNCNLIITDTNYPLGSDACTLDYVELTTNAPIPAPTNTIYSENFNAATFPTGWTSTNGAASANWIISNTTNAGGAANEAMLDWTTGSDNSTWYLISPQIDITGQTNIQLSFIHDLWQFGTGFNLYIETSIDGTNWVPQYTHANPPDLTETRNVDISSVDGNTMLYIRYRFSGDSNDLFHWAIDNIVITADGTPSPPQVTWSPFTGLFTDSTLTTPYSGGFAGTVYAAPNGSQTYIATDAASCTDNVTVISNKKTWNGTLGNIDWNTATNWTPNGVPTATECIVIPDTGGNNPVISGTTDGLGYRLIIESGANLTLDDDILDTNYASLTIGEDIILQNNSLLHIQNNSSLVQINESTPNNNNNTGTGTLIMDRVPIVSNTDYVYWSSPVSDMSLGLIYGADTPNATYQWIPTIDTGNTITVPPGPCNNINIPIVDGDWQTYAGNMDIGKGYISNGPTTQGAGATNYLTSIYGTLPNNGVITQTIESGINLSTNCAFTYVYPLTGNNLTVTPFDDNWNLIGNPYPSAISANAFINYSSGGVDNTSIEGAVHIWTHASPIAAIADPFYDDYVLNYNPSDYLTYNLTGTNTYPNEIVAADYFIGAGQGFFVLKDESTDATPSLDVTFSNTMRNITHDNTNFYRNNSDENPETNNAIERHRIWLNLSNENAQTSSTLVGYIEGATQEKDRTFDAYTFESNTMSIYSMIEDKRIVIQGRQLPFEDTDQVPLGIDILQEGNYIISIAGVDGLFDADNVQDIYLEDTHEGIIHDLRLSPYTFSSDIGSFKNRFFLRYTNNQLSIDDFDALNGIRVFEENEKLVVKSEYETIESIEVFDILGRRLYTNNTVNLNRFTIANLSPSQTTLFLKIKLTDGKQKIAKVIF